MSARMMTALRGLGAAALVAAGLALQGVAPVAAQNSHMEIGHAETGAMRTVSLGLGKSLVIDLPREARDVLVASPDVADAVMRTARRAYLIGMSVGQTNVFFFDGAGRQIAVLDVQVERDLGILSQTLRQIIPGSDVRVQSVNDNIVLTGTVPTASDSVNAASIAGRFVDDPERVLNMIQTHGSEQVHLKVTVAEMKRNMLKQLGVDIQALIDGGTKLAVLTDTPFGLGGALSGTFLEGAFGGGDDRLGVAIRAAEQNGILRVLAEPTLSAISGESAEFLAGGEFPVPVGYDNDTNTVTIEYKPFGVSLAFTPIVMSGGRISLKISTEVSELTSESAVSVGPISVPGLTTRRANSTIELPSGGSLVLAGLLQQNTRQAINGLPGLKDVPVLGALFRSRDYQSNETELVVIATPYLVKPTAPDQLVRPDRNFEPASDPETLFLGRVNKIYGAPGAAPKGSYRGSVGFIIE